MYSFNVLLGFLDELLELKESIKHESTVLQCIWRGHARGNVSHYYIGYWYDECFTARYLGDVHKGSSLPVHVTCFSLLPAQTHMRY